MLDDTDAVLLSRYEKESAEDAFTELVRRHIDGVYSAALRRLGGDAYLAEDVTQTVFTALARQSGKLSRYAVLTGWLYVTTRNHAITLVRRERRRAEREQKAQVMNPIFDDAPSLMDWSQIAPVLDSFLDQLNEADRNAVLLRFVDGRAFAEIGDALHLSEDAARMRVDRALGKLRILLTRKGVTSSTAALALALTNHVAAAAPAGMVEAVAASAIGVGSSTGAGTIVAAELMGATKMVVTIAAVLAALAGAGTAIHETRAARNTTAALTAAAMAERDLAAQQKIVDDKLRTPALAGMRSQAKETSDTSGTWNPVAEGDAFLARHPEIRQALIAHETAVCMTRYGPVLKSLKLTGDQVDQFIQLMLKNSYGTGFPYGPNGEYLVLRPVEGPGPDPRGISQKLTAVLGEQGAEQFGEIMHDEGARNLTADAASALAFTDTPIDPQQAAQLTQLFANNRLKANGAGPSVNWDTVIAQAHAILSAPQIEALAEIRAQADAEVAWHRARATATPAATSSN